MSQQCVHLHTKKELYATKKILKKQGMEIIVQSNNATIPFGDLTAEEKKSYVLEIEKESKEQLKLNEMTFKNFGMVMKDYSSFKNEIFGSFNLLKNNPGKFKMSQKHYDFSVKINLLGYAMINCSQGIENIVDPFHLISREASLGHGSSRHFPTNGISMATIRCSLLVAKKGDNTVRYLSFKRDPILTITGPEAKNIKLILRSKF